MWWNVELWRNIRSGIEFKNVMESDRKWKFATKGGENCKKFEKNIRSEIKRARELLSSIGFIKY